MKITYNEIDYVQFRLFSSSIVNSFEESDLLEDKIFDVLAMNPVGEAEFTDFIKQQEQRAFYILCAEPLQQNENETYDSFELISKINKLSRGFGQINPKPVRE